MGYGNFRENALYRARNRNMTHRSGRFSWAWNDKMADLTAVETPPPPTDTSSALQASVELSPAAWSLPLVLRECEESTRVDDEELPRPMWVVEDVSP